MCIWAICYEILLMARCSPNSTQFGIRARFRPRMAIRGFGLQRFQKKKKMYNKNNNKGIWEFF